MSEEKKYTFRCTVCGWEVTVDTPELPAEEKKYTFRCTVCGWEVTVDTPELPEDFVCEVCGVGPDMFELVEE